MNNVIAKEKKKQYPAGMDWMGEIYYTQ